MQTTTLMDKLDNVKIEVEAGMSLRNALRTVLSYSLIEYDSMTDSDIVKRLIDAIDYEYVERPRWNSGEPVHEGDCYMDEGKIRTVTCVYTRTMSYDDRVFQSDYNLIDTQERIDKDSTMLSDAYVSNILKLDTSDITEHQMWKLMIEDLLYRQSELERSK